MHLGNLQSMVEATESNLASNLASCLESSLELEGSDKAEPCPSESVVSFHAELPAALQRSMAGFIERYPNWDQYRLIQAALAGFLVQNGVESREITRLYVGNMFSRESLIQGV